MTEIVHTIEACNNCLGEDMVTVQCMAVEVVNRAVAVGVDCSMVHAIQDKQAAHTRGWEAAEDVGMDRLALDKGVAVHKADMAENIPASNDLQEGGYMVAEAENIRASDALQEVGYMAAEAVMGAEEHFVETEHSSVGWIALQ